MTNLLTLLTLKFRKVHNALSFWHSHSESLCLFSKFSIFCSSTVSDSDNSVSSCSFATVSVSTTVPWVPWEMQCVLSHSTGFPRESHFHGQAC